MAQDIRENLRLLAACWRDQRSGGVFVEGEAGEAGLVAELHQGGLCRPEQLSSLTRALARGRLRFEAGPRRGPGDRRSMARVLLSVGRLFAERVHPTTPPPPAVELVMPADRAALLMSSALLRRLSAGPAAVQELLDGGLASLVELRTLGWIGVLRTARPRVPRPMDATTPAARRSASFGVGEAESLLSGFEEAASVEPVPVAIERALIDGARTDPPVPRRVQAGFLAMMEAERRGPRPSRALDGFELGPLVGALVASSRGS